MRKFLFTLLLVATIGSTSFSQFGIKAGYSMGILANKTPNKAKIQPGFQIGVNWISENTRLDVVVEPWFPKDSVQMSLTPITLGYDYVFRDAVLRPFIGLNFGVYWERRAKEVYGNKIVDGEPYFGLYPKVGIDYEITYNLYLDVTAKYHILFDLGVEKAKNPHYFGLAVGLTYRFG